MILIADSGSSKTDWRVLDRKEPPIHLKSKGLNPVSNSSEFIREELSVTFADKGLRQNVTDVYFFGAGCWDAASCANMEKDLQAIFPRANTNVGSDLLGAVKATANDDAGIVCILGTGSNSCWYNGKDIIDNLPSLGYIIGDEGAGVYLGKKLIRNYFYRELPKELHDAFEKNYSLTKKELIQHTYFTTGANRYLASFVPFLKNNLAHPFVVNLLKDSFEEFLIRHVFKYPVYSMLPIHFVGSIAYHFKPLLLTCLEKHQLQVGRILEKPIEGLQAYYNSTLI